MAKSKKTNIEVVTTTPGIALELTPEEACYLTMILSRVGGRPAKNSVIAPRGHVDNIYNALLELTAEFQHVPVCHIEGSIHVEFEGWASNK